MLEEVVFKDLHYLSNDGKVRNTHKMSRSTLPTPTFQSGEAYTPRFELWMNGIVWQAIYNVVNSFTMQEVASITGPQGLMSGTHAPFDIFIQRVDILEDTVLSIQKGDPRWEEDEKGFSKEKQPIERAHMKYRALLKLLHRTGHVRFKPPRDFADD